MSEIMNDSHSPPTFLHQQQQKRIHLLVDASYNSLCAQLVPGSTLPESSVVLSVERLVELVTELRNVISAHAFDARTTDKRSDADAWAACNVQRKLYDDETLEGGAALLRAQALRELDKESADRQSHTLVLLTGRAHIDRATANLPEVIESAIRRDWSVEIWCWADHTDEILRDMQSYYPGSVSVNYLDAFRTQVTRFEVPVKRKYEARKAYKSTIGKSTGAVGSESRDVLQMLESLASATREVQRASSKLEEDLLPTPTHPPKQLGPLKIKTKSTPEPKPAATASKSSHASALYDAVDALIDPLSELHPFSRNSSSASASNSSSSLARKVKTASSSEDALPEVGLSSSVKKVPLIPPPPAGPPPRYGSAPPTSIPSPPPVAKVPLVPVSASASAPVQAVPVPVPVSAGATPALPPPLMRPPPATMAFNVDLITCPITTEIIVQAMSSKCGHTFEKSAIEDWLKKSSACPSCNQTMKLEDLSRNIMVENIIENLRSSGQI